jgi:flagellar biogenesis protein FliO
VREAKGAGERDVSHMNTPKEQEQSAEERIGSMIGKIFVLALIAFFAWGYGSTLAAKLGLF